MENESLPGMREDVIYWDKNNKKTGSFPWGGVPKDGDTVYSGPRWRPSGADTCVYKDHDNPRAAVPFNTSFFFTWTFLGILYDRCAPAGKQAQIGSEFEVIRIGRVTTVPGGTKDKLGIAYYLDSENRAYRSIRTAGPRALKASERGPRR